MEIKTFIFFDLETTGLIKEKIMPRITEIALVAVSRESIFNCNKNSIPRLLSKLVLPVNPQTMIPPIVEDMTKLYNDDMQLVQPFEIEVYELIISFLQRFSPPICFVAHNGNKFDYPIFLAELACINKTLNNQILCIDTWEMFRDFYNKRNLEPKIQDLLNDEYNDSLSMLDIDMMIKEGNVEVINVPTSSTATTSTVTMSTATTSTVQTMFSCDKSIESENKKLYSNEQYNNDLRLSKNLIQEMNEKTPENQKIRPDHVFAQRPFKKNIPKKLNFECDRPISLKLNVIYEYMFDSKFSGHSAERDCLAMIRCVINIADFFLNWSDNHAIPLICWKKT